MSELLMPVLTVIGTMIMIVQLMDYLKEGRIKRFRADYRSLSNGRYIYSMRMFYEYKALSKVGTGSEYLLSENRWMPEEPIRLEKGHNLTEPGLEIVKLVPEQDSEKGCKDARRRVRHSAFADWRFYRMFPDVSILGSDYVDNMRRYLDKGIFSGKIGRMVKVDCGPPIEIRVAESDYFDYCNTCEFIALHAVQEINREKDRRFERGPTKIGRKCCLKDPFNGDNRCVGIGINTLTILKNIDRKSYFLIHRRSDVVNEAMNATSLVPCGSYQFDTGQENREQDDTDNIHNIIKDIYREFEEEIKGVSEVEYTAHYSIPPEYDQFDYHFLGMGLDPLTTKLEIITCMVTDVRDNSFFKITNSDRKTMHKEGKNEADIILGKIHPNSEGSIELVEFNEKNLELHQNDMKAMPLYREAMRLALKFSDDLLR